MILLPPRRRTLRAFLIGIVVATTLGGCASLTEEYSRRQEIVYVPAEAQPVNRVRWDHMRNIRPLNERMILLDVRRRPHLLVLAQPCRGLRRSSIMVINRTTSEFEPRRDAIGILNQGPIATTATCVTDALYALEDDDVNALKAAI